MILHIKDLLHKVHTQNLDWQRTLTCNSQGKNKQGDKGYLGKAFILPSNLKNKN